MLSAEGKTGDQKLRQFGFAHARLSGFDGILGAVEFQGGLVVVPDQKAGARIAVARLADGTGIHQYFVRRYAQAGGTIGLAQFVKKRGDGRALMTTGLVMAGAILTNKSPVDFAHVMPIARLTQEWQAIAVLKNSDLKTVADLVQRLKTNPGAVSWGGGSAGGADQMTAGLFAKAVGADPAKMNYVAHSGGGQAMATILGGHVTLGVNSASEFLDQVEAGQLRFLAVSSDKRISGIDAPTLRELGIELVFSNWRGVVAPPGISPADRKALGEAVEKMAKSAQWQAIMAKRGWIDAYLPTAEFEAFLKDERVRVEATLRSIGLVR